MKLLVRRGVLVEEQDQAYLADTNGDSDGARALGPLQAAAPRDAHSKQNLCADSVGFSRHAAVRRAADGGGRECEFDDDGVAGSSSRGFVPACRRTQCEPIAADHWAQ